MNLEELRLQIDEIDTELLCLFEKRMRVAAEIAKYKQENHLPVLDASREEVKLNDVASKLPEDLQDYGRTLYKELFALSRDHQRHAMQKHCGLLGRTLGHSYSPQIHGELGDYEYHLYEKEPEELDAFLKSRDFDGLNVTIPYKKAVMPYCAALSDTAKAIGSVNTLVKRTDGTLYGDNTDAFGLECLIRHNHIAVSGKKALVLGSGGTSLTACTVLKEMGAETIVVISRNGEDNYGNLSRHNDAEIIVNTTPVGMYPHNGEQAVDLRQFPHLSGVVDVIYNPIRTALLLQAEERGIPHAGGLYMLVAQAKRSSEAFMGTPIDDGEIARIEKKLRGQMQNIILVGMPGCGKTTVSQALGERLHREVIDTDAEIEKRAGMSIPDIFREFGEAHFRALETEVMGDVGKQGGKIISTGGGCVTREENYSLLHQNGVIFWIQRDLTALARDGRPLSQSGDLQEMYEKRRPCYDYFADACIDNNGTVADAVSQITEALS
ncbi:MAG: shikimate kinase [Eubacteriales bacterium]|nr:shikimate kinase [Eubacteriales bacterium]